MQVSAGKIVVLGTGGTIAGKAGSAGDNIGYVAGQVGVQELLEAVPGLMQAAQGPLQMEQVAQIDSKDMQFSVWSDLATRCLRYLADDTARAIVITHGTDTLEETAWFLQSVLNATKPVVLTCAMRPATAMAPDGPQNLLDAMAVATAPGARGVLAVCAGVVHGARQVQKVHPYRVDAFSSGETGPLGWVEEGHVRWAEKSLPALCGRAPAALEKIANGAPWPRVEIVMNYAGARGATVDALVRDGVQGLVVAATGNGSVHHDLQAALERAQTAGVAVRVSTRCAQGQVLPRTGALLPLGHGLSPVKERVSLMLELLGGGTLA
ncbi:MAG TPA: asparaginase [Giesbergeria sp.]|nr:asparaginase [Giesbergeria sp.]HRA14067.1 asparaginase [Giesbergeria sp.]